MSAYKCFYLDSGEYLIGYLTHTKFSDKNWEVIQTTLKPSLRLTHLEASPMSIAHGTLLDQEVSQWNKEDLFETYLDVPQTIREAKVITSFFIHEELWNRIFKEAKETWERKQKEEINNNCQ